MEFKNKCDCIVNYKDLEEAIINQVYIDNKKIKDRYTITLWGGYPTICIAHTHYRIHYLLGKYYFSGYDKQKSIHHKDLNKLNSLKDNLELVTNSEHIKLHKIYRYVDEEYQKSYGVRMVDIIRRNDVTIENVRLLRDMGLTIKEIAEKLSCGINTVNRRLGMKD